MSKIALCISGLPRFASDNFENIKRNLIDPNQADVFIHTWNGNNIFDSYEPKRIIFEEQKIFKQDSLNLHRISCIDGRRPIVYCQALYSQFYSMMKCNTLKEEYRLENNIEYDYVIRARFDGVYNQPVVCSDFSNKFVWTDKSHLRYGWPSARMIEDWFAFSSNQNMNIYTSGFPFINFLSEKSLNEDSMFCGEVIIYEMLKMFNLEHRFIDGLGFHLKRN